MNSYELSRNWFDWCYENPEKVSPNHTAMYFFIIDHSNRLGWPAKVGLPTEMTKQAIGISNYRTFAKTFNDLIDWGFIKLIQKSKNQFSTNIIAIVKNTKAKSKALDKARQNHVQSTVDIIKPQNPKTTTEEIDVAEIDLHTSIEDLNPAVAAPKNYHESFKTQSLSDQEWQESLFMKNVLNPSTIKPALTDYNIHLTQQSEIKLSLKDYKSHFVNWVKKRKELKAKTQ